MTCRCSKHSHGSGEPEPDPWASIIEPTVIEPEPAEWIAAFEADRARQTNDARARSLAERVNRVRRPETPPAAFPMIARGGRPNPNGKNR